VGGKGEVAVRNMHTHGEKSPRRREPAEVRDGKGPSEPLGGGNAEERGTGCRQEKSPTHRVRVGQGDCRPAGEEEKKSN